jgi:non-heme chloroperoxidase
VITYKKILPLLLFSCVIFTQCLAANPNSHWKQGVIDSDGVKIHYISNAIPASREQTNFPSLLFIPGLSMPAWIFEKQLQYFSQKYLVLAMDPRSQGDSSQTPEGQYAASRAQDIKAIVDQLHLKPVVLIGWSLAVSEVVSYLDQFGSDGIAAVVLIDGVVGYDLCSPTMPMVQKYWIDFQKNRSNNTSEFVQSMFKQTQTKEYLDTLTAASLRTPTNTFMTLVYNMIFTDLRPSLPAINTPTLIFTIKDSWLDNIKEMQKLIPNSRLEIIENAGHALFVDQPDQFNKILENFLKENAHKL